MIALLFLFSLAHASSSGGSSNAVTSTTTTPPPLVHQSACDFLAPLANYTAVGAKVESNGNYNLPLANPSGKRVNLTNIGGNSVSYALLGSEHLFKLRAMNREEQESTCGCLSKLSHKESRGTIIRRETDKVCRNILCSDLTADILEKNELLTKLKEHELIDLKLGTLAKLVENHVLTPSEFEYVKEERERSQNSDDEQKLTKLRNEVLYQMEAELDMAEKTKEVMCELAEKYGKFLEY